MLIVKKYLLLLIRACSAAVIPSVPAQGSDTLRSFDPEVPYTGHKSQYGMIASQMTMPETANSTSGTATGPIVGDSHIRTHLKASSVKRVCMAMERLFQGGE